jgi:hypothetical protein
VSKYLSLEKEFVMPQEKEVLALLEKDYATYEKTIKSFLKSLSRIQEFLSGVFQILPSEIFVILGISLCILILLNSVSKKIKEYHLFISVLIAVLGCIITSRFVLHKHRDIGFLTSGIIILVPSYLFSLIVYTITYARKQYLKNKIASPLQIESSMHQLHIAYNNSMQYMHKYLANDEINIQEVKEHLQVLKISTEGLIKALEFPAKDINQNKEMKPPIESTDPTS